MRVRGLSIVVVVALATLGISSPISASVKSVSPNTVADNPALFSGYIAHTKPNTTISYKAVTATWVHPKMNCSDGKAL